MEYKQEGDPRRRVAFRPGVLRASRPEVPNVIELMELLLMGLGYYVIAHDAGASVHALGNVQDGTVPC